MSDVAFSESFWLRLASRVTFGLWRPVKGDVPATPSDSSSYLGDDVPRQVSDDRATQISVVFRAIHLLSTTTGTLPMPLYERLPNGRGRRQVRDHWAARIARKPNPIMPGFLVREVQAAHIVSWGDSFNFLVRDGEGRVREIWPLPPERVEVDRYDDFRARYWYTTPRDRKVEIPPAEMMHIHGFGFDGYRGMSPLAMARRSLNIASAAQDEAQGFFNAAGRPLDGVLTVNRLLDPELRKQYRKRYGELGKGSPQERRLWILEDGMDYKPVSLRDEDAQYLNTRKFEVEEISRYFGVPLHLLNHVDKQVSWGNGLEQQNQGFLTYTLSQLLNRVETGWDSLLSDAEQDAMYFEHNAEALLRADSAGRASFYTAMVDGGIMSRNEVRAKENLPEAEGAAAELTVKQGTVMLRSLLTEPVQQQED